MSINYNQKTWANGESGNTPIIADDLNRMEQGIADAVKAINEGGGGGGGTGNYPDLTNKPSINGMELLGSMNIGLLSTNIKVSAGMIAYNQVVSVAPVTSGASPSRMTIRDTVRNALDSLKAFVNKNVFNENVHGLEVRKSTTTGDNRYRFVKWDGINDEVIELNGAYIESDITLLDQNGNAESVERATPNRTAYLMQTRLANKTLHNIENTTISKNILRASNINSVVPPLGKYMNNQYVRVTSGYTYTSTDNKAWTQTANNITGTYSNMNVAYNGSVYVLIADVGFTLDFYYSSDLLSWTKAANYMYDSSDGGSTVPFVINNKFYLYTKIVYDDTTTPSTIYNCVSSTDGATWSEETLDSTSLGYIYASNNTFYQDGNSVIIGSYTEKAVIRTTNGTSFSIVGVVDEDSSGYDYQITKKDGVYYLTQEDCQNIYTSDDLESWVQHELTFDLTSYYVDKPVFIDDTIIIPCVDTSYSHYGVLYGNKQTIYPDNYDFAHLKFFELSEPTAGSFVPITDDINDVSRSKMYYLEGSGGAVDNYEIFNSTPFLNEVDKAAQELGIGTSNVAITVSGETLNITT